MAKRQYPIARVQLQAPGRRWGVKYDGFGHQDLLSESLRAGQVSVQPVSFSSLGVPPPGNLGLQVPSAMLVDHPRLQCVVARPFLDTTQSLGLGHFTTHGGAWVALPDHGLPGEVQLFQYQGHAGQTTGAVSNFSLPPDPVIALSLYRADPPPEQNWHSAPPHTEIHLGVSAQEEWAIVLPYGAPLYLMRRQGGQWHKLPEAERTVRVPSLEGYSAGQRLLLWIAVWRERLVLSTDGFAEDLWVYESPQGAVRLQPGPISLWHNAGQFMFSVLPIAMPPAVLDSAPVEAGYPTRDSAGELLVHYRHRAVTDAQGQALSEAQVADTTLVREDLSATQRAWRAELTPYLWEQEEVGTDPGSGQPVGFRTCVSPELYSVLLGQYPELQELPAPELEDLSASVKAVEGDHSDRLRTVRYSLELDNQPADAPEVREYQRATVELGWRYDDDSEQYAPAVDGYVVEPPPEVLSGGRAGLQVTLLDDMLRLRDEKADGRTPIFDGWAVKEVCHWVLDRCGLPRERQQIEDTGTTLSLGTPESPLWLPEPGRSLLELLEEVARFDYGAALLCDAEGNFTKACPHCREPRNATEAAQHDGSLSGACPAGPHWELYTRPDAVADPEAGREILSLSRPRRSVSEQEYANYVAVSGLDEQGRAVRAVAYDAESLYDPDSERYVGWRKMEVLALRNYTTQAQVNRLAMTLLVARSGRPEYVQLLLPLEPQMRIGQVLVIRGGEQLGVDGQQYRLQALRHRLSRGPRATAVTWVKAKWVGEG